MQLKHLFIAISVMGLVACGFKGPLVLPKQSPNSQPTPNQFAPNISETESGIVESAPSSSNNSTTYNAPAKIEID